MQEDVIVHEVKVRLSPYPWWKRFTVVARMLFSGEFEFAGTLNDAKWRNSPGEDYANTRCSSRPTTPPSQRP
jgi:hypothetical protein